jgi:NAD(P)-dependent dehydrogenase (short-subunit alcohol dehydrogenase family)
VNLAVVTGAGSGIGRATALAFAQRGAEVAAVDIDEATAVETAARCRRFGVNAHPYRVDVGDAEAMEAFAKTVRHELGVPDVVVNNAGIGISGSLLDTTVEDWRRLLQVNLWGVIHGSRLFGLQMVERGEGGHIVNVASAAAFAPSRAVPAYSTTKAAVLMLTECLRAELHDAGIGVSAICPGLISTGMASSTRHVGLSDADQQRHRERIERIARRRNFPPEKVAAAILRAVRDNRAVVLVAPEAYALRLLSRAAPAALRRLARVATLAP